MSNCKTVFSFCIFKFVIISLEVWHSARGRIQEPSAHFNISSTGAVNMVQSGLLTI